MIPGYLENPGGSQFRSGASYGSHPANLGNLPPGTPAVRIAGSPWCPNQAYVQGPHLGMQCHVEITPEMIDAAGVDRGVARQQMTEVLQGAELVVAHNMAFDRAGLRWLGVFVPPSKQYCTMENLVPPSAKWPRPSEAVSKLGIQVEGQPHRAETDARTAGRIFIEMVRRGF